MASQVLNTIKDKIKEKLQGITDIQAIYEYATINFSGYPAAVINFQTIDSSVEDLKHNERIYRFIVHLFYESENTSREMAQARLEDVAEQVVNAFETDQFLDGITMPSGIDALWIRPSTNPIVKEDKWLICDIELPIRVSFSII